MEWLQENWIYILVCIIAVLELVMRFKPTDKNWSILDMIIRVLQTLIPNNAKTEGGINAKFKTTKKFK